MDTCPHCGSNMQGPPIPEKHLHHNVPGDPFYNPKEPTCEESKARWAKIRPGEERCFCLPYGGDNTHFSRLIGVEISGVYDGVLFWQCPDCGGRWHRWPEGSTLRARAELHVNPPLGTEVSDA